jgi:hypothetical protein
MTSFSASAQSRQYRAGEAAIRDYNANAAAQDAANARAAAAAARKKAIDDAYFKDHPYIADPKWRATTNLLSQLKKFSDKNEEELRLLRNANQGDSPRALQLETYLTNAKSNMVYQTRIQKDLEAEWKLKQYYRTNPSQ